MARPAAPARTPPLRFADILGQRDAIWRLQTAVALGRLHHALLFDGPAGCGKTSLAVALAAALCCRRAPARPPAPPPPIKEARGFAASFRGGPASALAAAGGPGGGEARSAEQPPGMIDLARLRDPIAWPLEACGTCASCRKMPEHPDLAVVEMEAGKTRIAIDRVREVIAEMGYRPHESAYRVVVIREADRLSEAASNALLKSLEEPGEGNVFVLTTARPTHLLPTIRSRCLRVPLRPLSIETVRGLLGARHPDASTEVLELAAGLSGGGVARGADLLAADPAAALRAASAFGEAVAGGDVAGILTAAEALAADRGALDVGLDLLLVLLRDRVAAEAGLPSILDRAAGGAREVFARHPVTAAAVEAERIAGVRRVVEVNANAHILFEWLGVTSARAVARARRGRSADG